MVSSNRRINASLVRQQDEMDCGAACLASVVKYYGGEETIHRIRELSGTTRDGASMLGLYQAARKLGFAAEGLQAENSNNLSELKDLAILHVSLEDRLHYVVFYGTSKDKLILGDPALGIQHMTHEELNQVWESKALLQLAPNGKFTRKKESAREKRSWAMAVIREDLHVIWIAAILGIVISILNFSTAIFTQKLVDDILVNRDIKKLGLSIGLVTILLVGRSVLSYLRGLSIVKQGKSFNNRIVGAFYGKLLRLPKVFFDTRKIGELIARMNDARKIQATINYLMGTTLIDSLILVSGVIFIFAYSSLLGLSIACAIPVYLFLSWRFDKPILTGQKAVMQSYATSESHYVDALQGIVEIKSSNREVIFEKFNRHIYGLFQGRQFQLAVLALKFSFWLEIMGVAFTMTIFGLASWLYLDKIIQLGELVALISIAASLIPSIIRLSTMNVQVKEMKVVFDRMFEFTRIDAEYEDIGDTQGESMNWFSMEVRGLFFRFTGQAELLKDISLRVEKGQIIAIFGESGSGKSTLLQVLMKFYPHERGKILINQQPIDEINTRAFREVVGYVPQEVKIFNGSILFNICLTDVPEDANRALELIDKFGFSTYFNRLPQGLKTVVGEEGINLSGGQKQLVGIARALFNRPELLLLDEATSAMDSDTEGFIIHLLNELKEQMGVVVVTHKLKTARVADMIYILHNGSMTDKGDHHSLLRSDNFYSKSYRDQNF